VTRELIDSEEAVKKIRRRSHTRNAGDGILLTRSQAFA
jgi:hypothetical protein